MQHKGTRALMVGAVALMVFAPGWSVRAQDMTQPLDTKAKTDLAAPPAAAPSATDSLPVPTGDVRPAGAALADLPEPKMTAVAPKPPEPVLTSTSPETLAVKSATMVSSLDPRTADRITTLRDAVAVGVLTNPATESVENNRRATDEELKQAKALYMPSVDLSANSGFVSINSDPKRGTGASSDLWASQASLTLTQMLFDGFYTKYENERQYHRVRSASHRVREFSELSGLDIVESYLDVLRQRELLAIASENVRQHESILAQIADGEQAGRSTKADVEQTKARLASARTQESAVRQALQTAEALFRRRVGDVPQPDLQVPTAPREMLETNVDDEVKQALTHSPTLDIKEADVNVATAEWKGTSYSMYPKVDFQVNGTVADNQDGVDGNTKEASAKVVANWNLYRGGGDAARNREFVYRQAQAKSERNSTARTLESDVRQTWTNMIAAGEKAEQFRKQADSNAMVVQAYKDQFNLDRRTLLDVLDSQNEWFVSRSNAINNGYLESFAIYRLLALRGSLFPALQIAYPKEANPADKS